MMPKGVYVRSPELRAQLAAHMKRVTRAKLGLKLSDEERRNISEKRNGVKLSEAHCKALSESHMGNPGYWTGKKRGPQSMEWRAAIGAASKGNKHRMGYSPAHTKHIFYGGVQFRSSWEAWFAVALDKRGIRWQYEPKRFYLGGCSYSPDFYFPDLDVYWEIKGWFRPDSQKKVALFRKQYPELSLVVATRTVLKLFEGERLPS